MIPPDTNTEDQAVSTSDGHASAQAEASAAGSANPSPGGHNVVLQDLHAYYGENHAVKGMSIEFPAHEVTAIIGPSGCGKSTMVRCINRMHEEIPGARAEGSVKLDEVDVYADGIDVTSVRRLIGMVFQKPNPFPTMSIFDNVAAGLKLTGARSDNLRERVHKSLRAVGLWGEVKNRLEAPGIGLSGGQQQRLCIARTIAVEPEVILMDEPCSALDPVATLKDRGADRRTQGPLHDRHRHPQHAAGGARGEHDRVHARRRTDRARTDEHDLHHAADERTERYVTGKFG